MSNRWDKPGVPHKGWSCVNVFDTRADGESADEASYDECQMCGNEKIRYVHVMRHPEHPEELHVGCQCAEKMSDDYFGPKEKEKALRGRAGRRAKWLQRKWRLSANGNLWIKVDGNRFIVMADRFKQGKFLGFINGVRISFSFHSQEQAQFALFDAAERLKESE
jgi:hypothetical protein